MKKILKSFKQVFLIEEEDLKNQSAVKPQGEKKKSEKSQEEKKTAAGVSFATNPCQNDTQSDKLKVADLITESPEKVKSDEAKSSLQTQSNIYGRTKNNIDCRLFLGGLPDNITGDELRKALEKYGKVVNVMIPIEKDTNKSKRYGYLEFDKQDSANACLDDHFVTVWGKRVEVKRAWPRGTIKKEENCNKKETKEVEGYEKFPFRSKNLETTIDGSLKSSSTESESIMEDTLPRYQELFEDYFKAKFFLQNLLGSEKNSNTPLNEEVKEQQEFSETEMEKILRGLCVYTEEESSEGEDFEDSSSYSDGIDSIVDLIELDFTEKIENRPRQLDQPGNALSSVKVKEGIVCDLCKWAPSGNSIEGFLAHCETFAHKQRLKERFKKDEIPDQNKTLTEANPKKVCQKNEQANKKKKPRKKQANKFVPLINSNIENKNPKNKNKFVLNEVIASLEAETEKSLKCRMCNKSIPHAPNIRVLMTNLSQHLQSKGHLARISELQQSALKSKNAPEKKLEAKVNVSNKEKATFDGKTQKTSKNGQGKKKFPDTTVLTKSESSSNATNTNRGLPVKSKSQSQQNILPKDTKKVRFRCLLCNYFCSKPDTLLAHLNSDPHLANDRRTFSKNVTLSSVWNDLTLCSRCGTCLYGCPSSIANHFVKCKVA